MAILIPTFVWVDENMSATECRKVGQALQQIINQKWEDKLETEFEIECQLELEFETHFSRFLMPTIRGSEAGSKKTLCRTGE